MSLTLAATQVSDTAKITPIYSIDFTAVYYIAY
jgi:hypothetical protein